jgi:hypothetical protein
VVKGNGIKLIDSNKEIDSLNTLLGFYTRNIDISNHLDTLEILLRFQEYIYEELDKLHIDFYELYKRVIQDKDHPEYHTIQEEYIEISGVLNFYKNSLDNRKFMLPSQILKEFHRISEMAEKNFIYAIYYKN